MCYTITTEYAQCSHETFEFHECVQNMKFHPWSDDDGEHDFLRIRLTKTRACPKCAGQEAPPFQLRVPRTLVVTNMPTSLQHGQPMFQEICELAYDAWVKDEPITVDTVHRTVERTIVEAAVAKAVEHHHTFFGNSDPAIPSVLPPMIRSILYPTICRELFVMAARERHRLTATREKSLEGMDTSDNEAYHAHRDQFLKAEKEDLFRDLGSKHPHHTKSDLSRTINHIADQIKSIRHQISPAKAKDMLRTLAFQETTYFTFPASIHQERKALMDYMIDAVRKSKQVSLLWIPDAAVREIIEKCEILAWSRRLGLDAERKVMFELVLGRLRGWRGDGADWEDGQGGEDEDGEVADAENGKNRDDDGREKKKLKPWRQPGRGKKLTLKTSF